MQLTGVGHPLPPIRTVPDSAHRNALDRISLGQPSRMRHHGANVDTALAEGSRKPRNKRACRIAGKARKVVTDDENLHGWATPVTGIDSDAGPVGTRWIYRPGPSDVSSERAASN